MPRALLSSAHKCICLNPSQPARNVSLLAEVRKTGQQPAWSLFNCFAPKWPSFWIVPTGEGRVESGSLPWTLAHCHPFPRLGAEKAGSRHSQPQVLRVGPEGMTRSGAELTALYVRGVQQTWVQIPAWPLIHCDLSQAP